MTVFSLPVIRLGTASVRIDGARGFDLKVLKVGRGRKCRAWAEGDGLDQLMSEPSESKIEMSPR